jgi:hypothetical protein
MNDIYNYIKLDYDDIIKKNVHYYNKFYNALCNIIESLSYAIIVVNLGVDNIMGQSICTIICTTICAVEEIVNIAYTLFDISKHSHIFIENNIKIVKYYENANNMYILSKEIKNNIDILFHSFLSFDFCAADKITDTVLINIQNAIEVAYRIVGNAIITVKLYANDYNIV